MTHYLGNFNCGWADEFDVHGFALMTAQEYEEFSLAFVKHADSAVYFYFGTNEGWDNEETHEEFLQHYKVKPISAEQYNTMLILFGTAEYGHFYNPATCDFDENY